MHIGCFFFIWVSYPPPRHTHRPSVSPSVSPCPTVSPCWAEWWPAWDASGIRPHWTTDFVPQTSHSSGTCRRKHWGKKQTDAYITCWNISLSLAFHKCLICSIYLHPFRFHYSVLQSLKFYCTSTYFFKHLFWQTQWYCINSSSAKKQLSTNVEPALP